MSLDEVTFEPIWHNNGYTTQVVRGHYHSFEFIERTYFPPLYSPKPVSVFYEFWPEDGEAREFSGGTIIESAYYTGIYGIMFLEIDDLIKFLDDFEKQEIKA